MKKIISLFCLVLGLFHYAQNQDLYSLAKGEFTGFNALYDEDNNLYGYVSIYSYGKSSEKTKKFEYVILDKNLNPVANKEFEGDITANGFYGYIDFRKKVMLIPNSFDSFSVKGKDFFSPRSMEIDLNTNNIKYKIYYDYDNGKFKEIAQPKNWKQEKAEDKQEKKEKGYNYRSVVFEIKEGGYLAIEYNDFGSYVNNNSLIKFDENKNEIWRYRYNKNGVKKENEELSIIEKDQKYIYCILQNNTKNLKSFSLLILDINSGKEIHNKPILGLSEDTLDRITNYYSYGQTIDNDKVFDDKIVMVGRNYTSPNNYNGFARLIIDKNNFSVDTKVINYQDDFKSYLPKLISNYTFSDAYDLRTKDFFFLKDGSVGILMEKYKPMTQYTAPKTKDLYYAITDKDFKVISVKVFEKEKSKWINNDYLFSQYLNDGNDVVFFYRDLQKDEETKAKNWILFINTIIDGNFKQEEVQISEKDKYITFPYVAKEGYILLREVNEKEKFNKIRLERLNY